METVKTASFEYLIDLAKKNPDGGYTFILDGESYQIEDVLGQSNTGISWFLSNK